MVSAIKSFSEISRITQLIPPNFLIFRKGLVNPNPDRAEKKKRNVVSPAEMVHSEDIYELKTKWFDNILLFTFARPALIDCSIYEAGILESATEEGKEKGRDEALFRCYI
jgi:hypothetical protein